MSNERNIYTFKDVKFKTGSREWCVSAIYFNLRETSIPSVTITVDPSHAPTDPMDPATPTGLQDLADWHKEAQQFALDKAEANLSFDIFKLEELEQAISLEKWIVTSGGIMISGSSFVLEITIEHPLVLANLSGMNLGSFAQRVKWSESAIKDASNVLDALIESAKLYLEGKVEELAVTPACNLDSGISATAMLEAARERLEDAVVSLESHLKWSPEYYPGCSYTSMPMTGDPAPLDGRTEQVAVSVGGLIAGISDNTLWDIVSRNLCSGFFLAIVPTYWEETLKLVPFTPWGKVKHTIPDTDISNITFPGFEKATLAGIVMSLKSPAGGGDGTVLAGKVADQEMRVDNVIYAPDTGLEGSYITFEQPHWLTEVNNLVAASSGEQTNFDTAEDSDLVRSAGNTSLGDKPQATDPATYQVWFMNYLCAIYVAMHQLYLQEYRKTLQVSIHTKLMFKHEGQYVVPGEVVRVSASFTDATVFDFYVTEVVHIIDVAGNTARTEITGAYPRPPSVPGHGGDDDEPICNPVWS